MKIFKGNIINKIVNSSDDFLYIENTESREELKIPLDQISFPIDRNITYNFSSEYNNKYSKYFFSINHPDFEIGKEYTCNILNTILENDIEYFIIESNYTRPLKVPKLPHQNNIKSLKIKVIDYKRGRPIINNIDYYNPEFEVGKEYQFKVKGFGTYENNKGEVIDAVILTYTDSEYIKVRSLNWHKENLWPYDSIICEVIGFNNSNYPKLKITDHRHPFYKISDIVEFEILSFKEFYHPISGNKYYKICLQDEHKLYYEVSALPNQEKRLIPGDKIKCEIKAIDSNVRLSQVDIDDPYFYSFESIITDRSLKNKYFLPFLKEENMMDNNRIQFQNQYNSRSAFWVLTYCNSLIPNLFQEAIKANNYTDAIEINNIILIFEKWILSSGILKAFTDSSKRAMSKHKISSEIDNRESISKVLPYLLNNKYNEFLEQISEPISFKKLCYFFSFSNIALINHDVFLKAVTEIVKYIKESEFYFANKLADSIEAKKNQYLDEIQDNYFIILPQISESYHNKLEQYFSWSHCQYLLYNSSSEFTKRNLVLAKYLRYQVYYNTETQLKENLLLSAFNLLTYWNTKSKLDFLSNNDPLQIIYTNFLETPIKISKNNENWEEIENAFKNKTVIKVKVIEPFYKGFKVEYNGVFGILPIHNVTCKYLRKYQFETIEWEVNAKIIIESNVFKLFVITQLNQDDPEFLSNNLRLGQKPKVGTILKGKVKSKMEYGIFIATEYGDGLLHVSNIDDEFIDKFPSIEYFQIDEILYVVVINVSEDMKIELGFKQLIDTEYHNFYHQKIYGYRLFEINSPDNVELGEIDKRLEFEKGCIIEQYAMLQEDILKKITHIKLAKQFYANTTNARSYLLNIYIDYFEALLFLDDLLIKYSFSEYELFKERIKSIKVKLDPKTIEEFPESETLVYFINILSLFNESSQESNDNLFQLIKIYSNNPTKQLLNILAKTTLANNLLISESSLQINEKDDRLNFSHTNLKRIRHFIQNGIFTLGESEEDIFQKEINNKIKYWNDRIKLDEGENLEFKSTFITPIPNEEKLRIVDSLEIKYSETTEASKRESLRRRIEEINGLTAKKRIIHSALKTIAAFANTSGGHLLIGVSDDKKIFGLESDYSSFSKEEDQNRDGFGKLFDSTLRDYFGVGFSSIHLRKEYLKFTEGDVLIVQVLPSIEEVFLFKDEDGKDTDGLLYVRNLSSTDKLEGVELARFIKAKFSKRIES